MENGIKEKIIRVIETLNVLDDFILDDTTLQLFQK